MAATGAARLPTVYGDVSRRRRYPSDHRVGAAVKDQYVDPTLPDSDRIGFNLGFGYDITDNFIVDFAYMYLYFLERQINNSNLSYTDGDAPFNGIYNSNAHLLGINLSYKF